MRGWIAIVLVAGCDHVFQLERDIDASLPPDAPIDANLDACPSEYAAISRGATRYRFVTTPSDWLAAQADCRDDTSPGITHLVEVTDQNELDAVQTAFPAPDPWRSWAGYARDTGSDPFVFFATTGPLLVPGDHVWKAGEPNNGLGDETVTYFGHNFNVADAPWDFMQVGHVCECDGRPVTKLFNVHPVQ